MTDETSDLWGEHCKIANLIEIKDVTEGFESYFIKTKLFIFQSQAYFQVLGLFTSVRPFYAC